MAITSDQYPLLIAAPMLQDYLVDKDTGTALAGGRVYFYHDTARTILKNVYYQTGVPGNYSYIPLPNPNDLTAVGTISDDNGNDTIPFFFPYNEEDTDEIDTYFVRVFSTNEDGSDAVEQFTRENFPFITSDQNTDDSGQQDLVNLIPNGQFTAHNDLPDDGLYPNGEESVTVAQGGAIGWTYNKVNTSTDTDYVRFEQILQEPDGLVGNPRFAINLECDSSAGATPTKELRMQFNNVNRFASDTQFYTFSFSGKSNTPNTQNIELQILKNFGTGGSADTRTSIETYTLAAGEWQQYSTNFVFGLNEDKTIGTANDDYVQLSMVLVLPSTFDISLTDFILTPGIINFNNYPERPDNMVFANALSGSLPTPNPDGSDLYLPIVITQAGATYDHSVVGTIEASFRNSTSMEEGPFLLCDGSTYLTSDYSDLGVPYSRLQSVLYDQGANGVPLYGTGSTFATAMVMDGLTSNIRLTTNNAGAQTGAADGALPTGFTFSNIHTGQASSVTASANGNHSIITLANTVGTTTVFHTNTTGFFISSSGANLNSLLYSQFAVSTIAAAGIPAGSYFTFEARPGPASFYVWFTVNGVGADPAPGGTGYRVNILSTYTAIEVAAILQNVLNGSQVSQIVCGAASTITGGNYWTFSANSVSYSVYYVKAGVGTAPVTGTPIEVEIDSSDTAAQVATKTVAAINSFKFGVPDFRGMYLIGVGSSKFDTRSGSRTSGIPNYYGNHVGTLDLADTYVDTANAIGEMANSGINWFIRY